MAERPSVKDILAAARRGGPAKPASESVHPAEPISQSEREAGAPEASVPDEPMALSSAPEPPAAPAAPLGRPMTLAEKLAAARGGGPAKPTAAKPAAPKPVAAAPEEAAPAAEEPPAEPAAPAAPLGRPMTLAEKLAAARSGGAKAAPAGAKPAAAKASPAAAAARPAAVARALPPLETMTDPKDLAEAARQAGAKKAAAARAADPAAAKAARPAKKAEVQAVPPRPQKAAALATAQADRRRVLTLPWVALGWGTFTAGLAAFTAACGRFMFPNVLAEPPSTIKVGVPSNFEPEEVSERWKAEWGFWIVRSSRYNGQDIVYALQSVCTHLGCPPNWLAGEQKFKCPCHGSGFYVSGVNFEGPAPRPLERFKVVLADDGQIMVDKSQKFQEEMGQWTDPDSFIPV